MKRTTLGVVVAGAAFALLMACPLPKPPDTKPPEIPPTQPGGLPGVRRVSLIELNRPSTGMFRIRTVEVGKTEPLIDRTGVIETQYANALDQSLRTPELLQLIVSSGNEKELKGAAKEKGDQKVVESGGPAMTLIAEVTRAYQEELKGEPDAYTIKYGTVTVVAGKPTRPFFSTDYDFRSGNTMAGIQGQELSEIPGATLKVGQSTGVATLQIIAPIQEIEGGVVQPKGLTDGGTDTGPIADVGGGDPIMPGGPNPPVGTQAIQRLAKRIAAVFNVSDVRKTPGVVQQLKR